MRDRCAIAVMAKAPVAGGSKTRLVPPMTGAQAASLAGAFLADITANIAAAACLAPVDPWVAFAPAGGEGAFAPYACPGTSFVLADGAGGFAPGVAALGQCLLHATRALLGRGYGAVCLVNSDSPTLPTAILAQAALILLGDSDQVVIGPAEDGGYYLIGMTRPHPALFRDIRWSTGAVAAETRTRADAAGLRLAELEPWYDVDDPASLDRLAASLTRPADPRAYAAPATAALLVTLGLIAEAR